MPDDLPLVRADAVLCERILVNLLQNAARHGAPPIRLEGRVAGDVLELAVSDAGPGVNGAIAGRAFEPFVAGPRTGGTGIGLALGRGLARAQGGELAPRADRRTHARRARPAARAGLPGGGMRRRARAGGQRRAAGAARHHGRAAGGGLRGQRGRDGRRGAGGRRAAPAGRGRPRPAPAGRQRRRGLPPPARVEPGAGGGGLGGQRGGREDRRPRRGRRRLRHQALRRGRAARARCAPR